MGKHASGGRDVGVQLGMLGMQVGEWTVASGLGIRTEKKEKEWAITLGFGLGQ